jgi:hypothetical protein
MTTSGGGSAVARSTSEASENRAPGPIGTTNLSSTTAHSAAWTAGRARRKTVAARRAAAAARSVPWTSATPASPTTASAPRWSASITTVAPSSCRAARPRDRARSRAARRARATRQRPARAPWPASRRRRRRTETRPQALAQDRLAAKRRGVEIRLAIAIDHHRALGRQPAEQRHDRGVGLLAATLGQLRPGLGDVGAPEAPQRLHDVELGGREVGDAGHGLRRQRS